MISLDRSTADSLRYRSPATASPAAIAAGFLLIGLLLIGPALAVTRQPPAVLATAVDPLLPATGQSGGLAVFAGSGGNTGSGELTGELGERDGQRRQTAPTVPVIGDARQLNQWLIRDIAREPVWARRGLSWLRNLHPLSVAALLVLTAMLLTQCSQLRRSELE